MWQGHDSKSKMCVSLRRNGQFYLGGATKKPLVFHTCKRRARDVNIMQHLPCAQVQETSTSEAVPSVAAAWHQPFQPGAESAGCPKTLPFFEIIKVHKDSKGSAEWKEKPKSQKLFMFLSKNACQNGNIPQVWVEMSDTNDYNKRKLLASICPRVSFKLILYRNYSQLGDRYTLAFYI